MVYQAQQSTHPPIKADTPPALPWGGGGTCIFPEIGQTNSPPHPQNPPV